MSSDALAVFADLSFELRRFVDGPAPRHTRQTMDPAAAEAALAEWLDLSVPEVRAALLAAWDDQREDLTATAVLHALAIGDLTGEVLERWRQSYSAFVVDHLAVLWRQGNGRASSFVAGSLGFELPAEAFTAQMELWIENKGGDLITYLTGRQHEAVKVVLKRAASEGLTSNTVAAQLKPIVGLRPNQARSLEAYRQALLDDEEVPNALVDSRVAARAKRMHQQRAKLIGRTELGNAYNEANIQTPRVAVAEGVLDEAPLKVWLTTENEKVCAICGPLHEVKAKLSATFDGGYDRPTAHPGCQCTLVFEFPPKE